MGRPQNRWHPCPSVPLQPKDHLRGCVMSELDSSLNKILERHQHESGLHMIGGRRKLLDRLVQFFEECRVESAEPRLRPGQNNELHVDHESHLPEDEANYDRYADTNYVSC